MAIRLLTHLRRLSPLHLPSPPRRSTRKARTSTAAWHCPWDHCHGDGSAGQLHGRAITETDFEVLGTVSANTGFFATQASSRGVRRPLRALRSSRDRRRHRDRPRFLCSRTLDYRSHHLRRDWPPTVCVSPAGRSGYLTAGQRGSGCRRANAQRGRNDIMKRRRFRLFTLARRSRPASLGRRKLSRLRLSAILTSAVSRGVHASLLIWKYPGPPLTGRHPHVPIRVFPSRSPTPRPTLIALQSRRGRLAEPRSSSAQPVTRNSCDYWDPESRPQPRCLRDRAATALGPGFDAFRSPAERAL